MMKALARIERTIHAMATELRLDVRTELDHRGTLPALTVRGHGIMLPRHAPAEPGRDM
jgi:hypothetical protein